MAVRKQFLKRSTSKPELLALLAKTKARVVTEEELAEQRVSFAFGNAGNDEYITKDSVRAAAHRTKLTA